MPPRFVNFGGVTVSTFSLFFALAALLCAGAALWRLRGTVAAGAAADAFIGALVGGAVGGRLAHVALHWDYFADHAGEIFRLSAGGLDWHGAVLGGLLGLAFVARWRKLDLALLLDALPTAPPLLAIAGWAGCLAWACGYGIEVDTLARYPSFAVSEAPDVYGIVAPRYNSQQLGIALSLAVLLASLCMLAIPRLRGARFWLSLALLGAAMFAVGFARGDAVATLAGLRLDQWLDLVVVVVCVGVVSFQSSVISRRRVMSNE